MDNLTAEETIEAYKLLNSLGIDISSFIKHKKMTEDMTNQMKYALPAEYNLVILVICETCKTSEELYFYMKQDLTQWGLVGVPLSEKPEKFKFKTENVDSCRNCRSVLMESSKEVLVDLIFDTIGKYTRKIYILSKI